MLFNLKASSILRATAILQVCAHMHTHLSALYECPCCRQTATLEKEDFPSVSKAFDKAVDHLHKKGGFTAADMDAKPIKTLTESTYSVFKDAIDPHIKHNVPPAMQQALRQNVFFFSGLKTYVSMKEASALLLDSSGNIKPLYQFKKEVTAINATYNQNYLEAEHGFATRSAQMADKWKQFEKDGDRYNLQYRTAGDDKVRQSHRLLHNITLPITDVFWEKYFTPNGWRCRCVVVQVRKGKYEESNSAEANRLGEEATTQIGSNGQNKAEIFRFNPGKQERIFPANHAYEKLTPAQAKETIEKQAREATGGFKIDKEVVTLTDLNDTLKTHAEAYPDYYARGFKKLQLETTAGINGSTDLRGTISLRSERVELVKSAMNAIKDNQPTSLAQEDALSTLWHEITHNRNKIGYVRMTNTQRREMELANEFVSRNTLPEFIKGLGGELQNQSLITDRSSTGYNTMVKNYDALITWSGADKAKVLEDVQTHLFNESYDNQMPGLVKAISKHSGLKLKSPKSLLVKARDYGHEYFVRHLEENKESLIKSSKR